MKPFDVAIVGAGPAGSSTAIFLARRGYSVALIDKQQFPREKLCGDFVNPATWPTLRELGVEEEILSCNHETVTKFRMTSFSGEEAEVPLVTGDGVTTSGLSVRRFDLDYVLLQKAKSQGVTVYEGFRIKRLRRERAGWRLEADNSQFVEGLSARLLIGADGRNSWVAHRLGLGRAPMHGRSVGFQVRLKCSNQANGKVQIHLFPGGYAGLVGLGDNAATLGFAVEKDRLRHHQPFEQLLDSCLSVNPHLKEILRRGEIAGEARSTYPVYFSPRRSYTDRALLVGDAARVNEPVTGEGIYFAMKSGQLAAKTVDQAFRKSDFSARHLRLYEQECRSAFAVRRGMNALIRWLIYRPILLSPLLRVSAKKTRFLDAIVHTICDPEIAAQKGNLVDSSPWLVG